MRIRQRPASGAKPTIGLTTWRPAIVTLVV